MENQNKIYTIGHSTHPIEKLLDLLNAHMIKCLADIRRFPTSRKHPQFTKENLLQSLTQAEILYIWLGDRLGGFRDGGYDAYLATEPFQSGLTELKSLGSQQATAFMCAESLYHRCHRRFVADELTRQNWQVLHIMPDGKILKHQARLL
ncbi:MAG TPA: DUF488 domain-containing protein [bacterium]